MVGTGVSVGGIGVKVDVGIGVKVLVGCGVDVGCSAGSQLAASIATITPIHKRLN